MPEKNAKLVQVFIDQFKERPTDQFFSPGRINLIGEHTDYNGGHVFPAAITIGTYGVARLRDDMLVKLYSLNFPDQGVITFDVNDETKLSHGSWGNFVKGVLQALRGYGNVFNQGFELVIEGNIPNASGLSSSASLELLIGVVAQKLYRLKVPRLQLVASGQRAENDFVGVNTGIMDQFAIGFGEKAHAIYLDTNTMIYDMVPVDLGDNVIVIMNTNKRRELADSKYNERVKETQEAVYELQQSLPIQSLGQLTSDTFEANAHLIKNDTILRRARHAVTENERTQLAVESLRANDLVKFGELLNASHDSLKNDYEVTGIELDTLAETAQKIPGVLGARMTGAGFGGCAIALVNRQAVDDLKTKVGQIYEETIGYAPSFYVADIGPGAHWIGEVKK
ncbi:galactokinase [Leuconostoc citreum]|jgi:galactokinase|uniref:galactokinase n=1 Tax=Leuconostoc citreum TaxID=33964 RepID=UPI0005134437|nr:galactokinase [Leuconostoc citreum]KAF0261302.1 galactokinase [Leuconostoc citreum]MBE4726613.1 galactokinase [Leuconostoc citreum]MBU7450239.1 galactokinase [Leuconostoc citreum]MCT3055306.1 galactokinase [Leuconostoc citreum]MCT3063080.1 galactokinase [Leuconostoc citreum]